MMASERNGDEPYPHECPIAGCSSIVPHNLLMCSTHWRKVPGDLSSALYRAYARRNRGEPNGRREHLQACENCIAHVEQRKPRDLFGEVDDDG